MVLISPITPVVAAFTESVTAVLFGAVDAEVSTACVAPELTVLVLGVEVVVAVVPVVTVVVTVLDFDEPGAGLLVPPFVLGPDVIEEIGRAHV